MKKKKLKISREELYAAVLLSCGPPPELEPPMPSHYMGKVDFSIWKTKSLWYKQFTQCVTGAGEAKARVDKYMWEFIRWHRLTMIRIEDAEFRVAQMKADTSTSV